MYAEEPLTINLGVVERVSHCPAAYGVGTKLPRNTLDRWIAVRDACASWHNGMDVDAAISTYFGVFDEVQRRICTLLFRRYVDLIGSTRDRWDNLEGEQLVVRHPTANAYATASATFVLNGDTGREFVKLRTGRHGSSAWERAVLVRALDPGDSVIEVMAPVGTIEELTMDEDDVEAALQEIFTLWDDHEAAPHGGGTRPGWWCFTCQRPARCGQYPTPDDRRVPASTRTVMVPKTWAQTLEVCERQTAWKRLYQIPRDDWTDDDDWRRTRGIAFHELAAAALASDDPDATFEALLTEVPDSERQNLAWLWERHTELEQSHEHPVQTIDTEYQVGTTITVRGPIVRRGTVVENQPVAVVLTGRADATGRESDRTPAVIELKTGPGADEISQMEADIYAVGTALLTDKEPVAVHFHQLGHPEGPRCIRTVFDGDALAQARERLTTLATRIAAWHPEDAMSPSYTPGPWCHSCDFRARCEDHRS